MEGGKTSVQSLDIFKFYLPANQVASTSPSVSLVWIPLSDMLEEITERVL